MRTVLLLASLSLVACGGDDPCGVSWDGDAPELGTLVLDDGTVLRSGTWAASRINAGTFTVDVRRMDDEATLGDAVAAGPFPVCRTLDDQNDQVIYHQDGSPWITDANHQGTLAIVALDGDNLEGRLQVTLRDTNGGSTTLRGAFLLPKSP